MDADLQDPPEMLPEMIKILENEDYDCVGTRRTTRAGEPPIRSFSPECFTKSSIRFLIPKSSMAPVIFAS